MRVLFVVSGNVDLMPYVHEQGLFLQTEGCQIDYFYIRGKGILGYLKNLLPLRKCIIRGGYNLIHAHYGFAGLLASFQSLIPVVVTFHGSDINFKSNRVFSFFASRLCDYSILVNKSMPGLIFLRKNYSIIPCGVDKTIFFRMEKNIARDKLGLSHKKKYILFSSAFKNPVKNYALAEQALYFLNHDAVILELNGFSRSHVSLLLNACDMLLMTSFSEGSPQIVKEALFCGTPIVSTRVGDVPDLINGISNCYLTEFNPIDVAKKINILLSRNSRLENNYSIEALDSRTIAKKILEIYRRFS